MLNLPYGSRRLLLSLLAVFVASTAQPARSDDRDVLRQSIEALNSTENPQIDGAPIAAAPGMTKLYERRAYKPIWDDPETVRQLYQQVQRSIEHGLNPEDFHVVQLGSRLKTSGQAKTPEYRADTEILCTDAVARLTVTLRYGKLDPSNLDPAWNFDRSLEWPNVIEVYDVALSSKQIADSIEAMAPQMEDYRQLCDALVDYRRLSDLGGWPQVPDGEALKLGSVDPRVTALRGRLVVTGNLDRSAAAEPERFDETLESAVIHFQTRHGISADGIVGPRCLEELNVPVEVRIDQIRATLERIRWVFRKNVDDFIIVDIAGYKLHLVKDGEEIWRTPVQVGKTYHATPVFRSEIKYLVLNPTWTVPPGIQRKEILPAIRRDPEYLSRNNMSVVHGDGTIVDPATIDWSASDKSFPYYIRQEPGPRNALGQVKFIFPNQYMVYLHDTPSKSHFSRTERAFSHGCIRTQNPLDLAVHLLDDQGWDRARVDSVIASRKTTRVNLKEPLTVMLLYWTAEVGPDGTVNFRKDLYGRDAAIIEGLNEPFRVDPPAGAREAVEG